MLAFRESLVGGPTVRTGEFTRSRDELQFHLGKRVATLTGLEPREQLCEIARFPLKFAVISPLTAFAQNRRIADSRRITQV